MKQLPDARSSRIGPSQDDNSLISMRLPYSPSQTVRIPMTVSFPIPPTLRSGRAVPHPYFALSRPGDTTTATLQWQIHPVQDGPLRYTLIDLAAEEAASEMPLVEVEVEEQLAAQSGIRAIYHHIGLGTSLSIDHSEGILLLPEPVGPEDAAWEGVVVASLLGLLSQVRGIQAESKQKEVKPRGRRWSLFKSLPAIRRHSL